MVNRLPTWVFLSLSMVLIGSALLPLMRVALGIDQVISMRFWTVVMLLIGGLMCALTAMILLVRRQPKLDRYVGDEIDIKTATRIHASGLLLFSGIPLANFLICYWLWIKYRTKSAYLDRQGQEALNFQITIYLYLLLSLFMTLAVIGLLTTPLVLMLHLIGTLLAIVRVADAKSFHYPANIPIIQGRVRQVNSSEQN